jgi:hypothetical protein
MTVTGAKGKADLLRLLAATQGLDRLRADPQVSVDAGPAAAKLPQGLVDAQPLAAMLGLELKRPQEDGHGVALLTGPALTLRASGTVGEALPAKAARPPLRARFFAVLQASRPQTLEEPNPSFINRRPLRAEDCAPRKKGSPPFVPLVGRSRLWPALYRSLACPRSGLVDLPVLVRKLASAQVPRRMPRRSVRNLGHELVVVVDRAHRLIPYDQDYTQLLRELRRLHGAVGISLWLVLEAPDATLSVQKDRGPRQSATGAIPVPPAGTSVLILGDLGQLSSDPAAGPAWVDFCRRLKERGAHPVAWVPMSGRLVSAELTRYAQVHCLAMGDLRPVKGRKLARAALAAPLLETLLTRLACCVRVEPALLRSLRLMSPDTAMEPGLEALVWSHAPVVEAGYRFCEIGRQYQALYRAAFGRLGADERGKAVQAEILRRMLAVHAYRGRSTESVEVLIWLAHAGAAVVPVDLAGQVDEASEWFRRLGEAPEGVSGDVAGYSRDLLARHGGDQSWVKANADALAPLWLLTKTKDIPLGLASEAITRARGKLLGQETISSYRLATRGQGLHLIKDDVPNGETDWRAHFGVMPVIHLGSGFEWRSLNGEIRTWIEVDGREVILPLCSYPDASQYQLIAGGRHYAIGLFSRPSWAIEWGSDGFEVYALAPSPIGPPVKLGWFHNSDSIWPGDWPPSPKAFRALEHQLSHGMRLGADLRFGLYLDVPFGREVQRFRYIEPGEFLMGSPAIEAERNDNEGPQHVVRLTEGYWLADTACSQALWQAVTGGNPSHFKDDPQNPVENVSWDEVDAFLRRLEAHLPGVKAALPTEAEWEYACRAGTKTAFSFGDAITPEQANYDGSQAYARGATRVFREKTLPVKTFAANSWGLYQMHGNVWEWCADSQRPYDGAPQTDPRGPGDFPCVLRGGSWRHGPEGIRSASRSVLGFGVRSSLMGFRFSLRSTSPEGGAERLPEAQVAPEESRFVGRIDKSERSSYLDFAMSVISPHGGDKSGPVPWTALKETLPPPRSKRRKSKSGGKK